MARLYGVLTAGRGAGTARRSLTSNEYITMDVAMKRKNGENVTLRMVVADGEMGLFKFDGRWADADKASLGMWESLVNIKEPAREVVNEAS